MILEKIVRAKKEEVAKLTTQRQAIMAASVAAQGRPCRDFAGALRRPHYRLGLIAEVKKASPSKGVIRPDFAPLDIAEAYASSGADAISVLTDAPFFQGKATYLQNIKDTVTIPVLRKDFIIDELQVYQSRAIGADAILLIATILEKEKLEHLYHLAYDLGMQVLIEVHREEELAEVMPLHPEVIGVNNRDLSTFHTTLEVTSRLAAQIPESIVTVSESGISRHRDIAQLIAWGVDAVLVGEHFMRQADVARAIVDLMEGEYTKQ